jgi:hypothetical protein
MLLELIPEARMARYINDHCLLLVRKGEDRLISLKRCVRWQVLRVDQLFHYKTVDHTIHPAITNLGKDRGFTSIWRSHEK